MALPDIFSLEVTNQVIDRINKLTAETQPQWGTMSVDKMLAHCNVTYDMAFTDKYPKPNFLISLLLKWFVKDGVVNEKPYKHNLKTAPAFMIADTRDFEKEKSQLIEYIRKTQSLGRKHFDGKPSLSFGALTADEWNNLFYKHLDHHCKQFGV